MSSTPIVIINCENYAYIYFEKNTLYGNPKQMKTSQNKQDVKNIQNIQIEQPYQGKRKYTRLYTYTELLRMYNEAFPNNIPDFETYKNSDVYRNYTETT